MSQFSGGLSKYTEIVHLLLKSNTITIRSYLNAESFLYILSPYIRKYTGKVH